MNLKLLPLLLCATGIVYAQTSSPELSANAPENLKPPTSEPPMLGIHWSRDFQPNARAGEDARAANDAHAAHTYTRRSPDMTYHGGVIMPKANAVAIFWGTSWASYTGDKITGIDSWYKGFDGSNYAKTSDEYTDSNGTVGPTVNYTGHIVDHSASASGGSTQTILNEVCKVITGNNLDSTGDGYYPVYTDTPRGNAGYCAWHSVGTCNGVRVQFAYFFKLDGDPGCDPQDTSTGHS